MKTSVVLSPQVLALLMDLGPDKRKLLRHELRRLERWTGREDPPRLKMLAGELAGYWRLRVARHRVIFFVKAEGGARHIECVYGWTRDNVYDDFKEALLLEEIRALGDAD